MVTTPLKKKKLAENQALRSAVQDMANVALTVMANVASTVMASKVASTFMASNMVSTVMASNMSIQVHRNQLHDSLFHKIPELDPSRCPSVPEGHVYYGQDTIAERRRRLD